MIVTQDPARLVYQCCTEHCTTGCPVRNAHKRPCAQCLAEVRGEPVSHPPHLCLSCSCQITPGKPEVQVKLKHGQVRYRHERSEDCAAALRNPPDEKPLPRRRAKGRRRAGKVRPPADQRVLSPEEFDAL